MNDVKWIPCADRMPDDETIVLVAIDPSHEQYGEPVWLGYHDGDDGWRTAEGLQVPVTHWMELPAAPVEVAA
jgi:hypothetical protein